MPDAHYRHSGTNLPLLHAKDRTGAAFNSSLDYSQMPKHRVVRLTLKVNVQFIPVSSAGQGKLAGVTRPKSRPLPNAAMQQWKDSEWKAWKTKAIKQIRDFWETAFYLRATKPTGLEWQADGKVFWPLFRCDMRVSEVGGGAHLKIAVIKVKPQYFSTSFYTNRTLWLDSNDTKLTYKGAAKVGKHMVHLKQVPLLHEFGHAIGLPHVGVARGLEGCGADTNAKACYGGSKVDALDLMGGGNERSPDHAKPWSNRLKHHLKPKFRDNDFIYSTTPQKPRVRLLQTAAPKKAI